MKRKEGTLNRRLQTILFVILCAGALLIASNGVITVISTNQVSNSGLSAYRWEPTSAAGSTWAHGWYEYNTGSSFVSAWNAATKVWSPQYKLTTSGGLSYADLNLNYDSYRSRFVFTAVDAQFNIWYGYSTDSTGTS